MFKSRPASAHFSASQSVNVRLDFSEDVKEEKGGEGGSNHVDVVVRVSRIDVARYVCSVVFTCAGIRRTHNS